nr:AraC family transcriptional regulator [Ruegeria alba]
MRRWLNETGRNAIPLLEKSGLDWVPEGDPFVPIPLRGAVSFLAEIARTEGPDAPFRIVGDQGAFEIGLIGAVAFSGSTVREGLQRVARHMRRHCTHELFFVDELEDAILVRDGWSLNLGPDDHLHAVQQYVAALVYMICSVASGRHGNAAAVEMLPHPQSGLAHLRPWLGSRVAPARSRALVMTIDNAVADQPMPEWVGMRMSGALIAEAPDLNTGSTLGDGLSVLLESMLSEKRPTVDYAARAAGVSARTLKRRLQDEDTSFSHILESVRVSLAQRLLSAKDPPSHAVVSKKLGFANQETLSRAIGRWKRKSMT